MLPMKLFATRVHPSRVNASQVQIKYLLTGNGNKMKPERVRPSQRGQFDVKFPLTIPDTDQPSSVYILECHKHIY